MPVVELLHRVHLVGALIRTPEHALRLLADRLLARVDDELGRDLGRRPSHVHTAVLGISEHPPSWAGTSLRDKPHCKSAHVLPGHAKVYNSLERGVVVNVGQDVGEVAHVVLVVPAPIRDAREVDTPYSRGVPGVGVDESLAIAERGVGCVSTHVRGDENVLRLPVVPQFTPPRLVTGLAETTASKAGREKKVARMVDVVCEAWGLVEEGSGVGVGVTVE